MTGNKSIHIQFVGGDRLLRLGTPSSAVWLLASNVQAVNETEIPATGETTNLQVDIVLKNGDPITLTGDQLPPGGAGQLPQLLWGDFHVDVADYGSGSIS